MAGARTFEVGTTQQEPLKTRVLKLHTRAPPPKYANLIRVILL
jgi:hypothetical protein